MRSGPGWFGAATALALALTGCMPALPGGGSDSVSVPSDMEAPDELVPAGFGSLRQEEISVDLVEGDVRVRVTPLAESVTRLAAPDTYRRLSALRERVAESVLRAGAVPFLVTFHSERIGSTFGPEDVMLWTRGRRLRPVAIEPISLDWGQGRLPQREPQSAIYLFAAEEDLLREAFEVEYRTARSSAWQSILIRLETERARVRARAGE